MQTKGQECLAEIGDVEERVESGWQSGWPVAGRVAGRVRRRRLHMFQDAVPAFEFHSYFKFNNSKQKPMANLSNGRGWRSAHAMRQPFSTEKPT